jgi:hypothetical protein
MLKFSKKCLIFSQKAENMIKKGGKWPLKFLPGRNSNYETKIEKEFLNLAVEKKNNSGHPWYKG